MITLGIDIGTTHIKACAAGHDGTILSSAVKAHETKQSKQYGLIYDCDDLWEITAECIRRAAAECKAAGFAEDIGAIGITSMAEAGVPVDQHGKPLTPIIPWNQANLSSGSFPEQLRGYALYERTGLLRHPKYAINRLLRLREKEEAIFQKMEHWLSVADYVLYRLSGEYWTDVSLAGRTMLFNLHTGTWDKELTAFAGMEGRLPRIQSPGTELPVISRNAAEELGLSKEAKIFCAGHDHLCAAYAEQMEEGAGILNSMGTSEVYTGFLAAPHVTEASYTHGILQGRFRSGYYWMCNMPSSGASVEWLRNLVSADRLLPYEELTEPAKEIPSALYYLPFLNGGGTHRGETRIKGGFLGILPGTNRADMLQGIYEGIAMEDRIILENLEEWGGCSTEPITAAGGGTKNTSLMEAKASVMGREIRISKNVQAAALGAALQAAKAAGASLDGISKEYHPVLPDPALKAPYDRKYLSYKKYCRLLAD